MSLPPSSFATLNKLIVKSGTKVSLHDRFSRIQKENNQQETQLRGSAIPTATTVQRARRAHTEAATARYGGGGGYQNHAQALRRPAQPMFTPTPMRSHSHSHVHSHQPSYLQHDSRGREDDFDDEYEDIDEEPDYPRYQSRGMGHRSRSVGNLRLLSGYSQNSSRQRTLQAAFQVKRRLGVRHRLGAVNKMRQNGYGPRPLNYGRGYNNNMNGGGSRGVSRGYGGVKSWRGGNGNNGHWRGGGNAGRQQRNFFYPRGRGRRGGGRGGGGNRRNQGPRVTKEQLDAQIDEYMANTRNALDKDLDEYMNKKEPEAAME